EAALAQNLTCHFAVAERKLATFRTGRRVAAQLLDRKRALLQEPQHLGADQSGYAHHSDTHETYSRSSPKAVCSERTARSTSSSATTHEMRIVDVLIISMFTPSVASVSNILAAIPGWVFIPAPTSDTRPICSSVRKPLASVSTTIFSMHCDARGVSARGTVKEMSVWPAVDTFCTIMSTLRPASARSRKIAAATPGGAGACSIVTLASGRPG